ncbi:Peroxiredoxin, OsmC-like protein domain-containing protein [Nitratireductor indicus C115]|uniref:Peroxiredoxin, OsmC-like protein domain-containing protein n=1 Tax=Nitratireductor indicus C115 TaxID=1231190 RepID=K2N177_9HYPH|nr:OsmC family protein [Nitratireductor indicus]EKF41248.1 Peroxiredoxin, OsmC-like protein domain-containing protein [Nitratireductor indicus C115]SFQ65102.1 OsmC-like protein [Nitratireductor indicus]
MAIRIKPKTYGPYTTAIGPNKIIHVATAAKQTVAITSPSTEEAGTPVDFLVSALGACLAPSFHHAAQEMKIDVGTVSVEVSARKAEDLPDRVGSYSAAVALDHVPGAEDCAELIKRAKARCTVSNSLNGPVEMRIAD